MIRDEISLSPQPSPLKGEGKKIIAKFGRTPDDNERER